MATYVLSDVHGDKRRWEQMLRLIKLQEEDILYVIGDAIDRGSEGIAILQAIRKMPNIRLLLGNHEYMMLQCFEKGANRVTTNNWMRNGGRKTIQTFLSLPEKEQMDVLAWLHSRPTHLEISVNGQSVYLVHGWPATTIHNEVWNRPRGIFEKTKLVPSNAKLIIGHTLVALVKCTTEQEQESYFRKLEQTGDHMRILHAPEYIDVDCGCGHDVPGATLACLRLDDMEEFYV